jgi:hypothetical protein
MNIATMLRISEYIRVEWPVVCKEEQQSGVPLVIRGFLGHNYETM